MKADGDADRLKQDFCKQVDEAKEQCSFEAFQRSQAFYAPLGGALVALSFALLHFGALVPFNFGSDGQALGQILDGLVKLLSKELIETDYAQTHVFAMLLFVIVLCCGLYFLHYADKQKKSVQRGASLLARKGRQKRTCQGGQSGATHDGCCCYLRRKRNYLIYQFAVFLPFARVSRGLFHLQWKCKPSLQHS